MIVTAKHSELPEILSLTKACAHEMMARNIFQWNDSYPSSKAFKNDIERKELLLFKRNNKIIATIVISSYMDSVYQKVKWLTPSHNNLYIHRLAVHPEHQQKGIARELMDYVLAFAKAKKAPSIRLDTFSQNKRNQKFYESRGYQKLGDIYFPNQSEYPFYCYEKIITSNESDLI